MATVHTGSNTFDFYNDTGVNVRLILNSCRGGGGGDGGIVEWGDFTTTSDSWSNAENKNASTCVKRFKTFDATSDWGLSYFGRNAPYNDLASYNYNKLRSYGWTYTPGTDAFEDPSFNMGNAAPDTILGLPCEYYLAPGHRFVLKAYALESNLNYNILQINGTAGTVYTGRGDFNYANSNGKNGRVIVQYLKNDYFTNLRWGRQLTGAASRFINGSLPDSIVKYGFGKYSIGNNHISNPFIGRWSGMEVNDRGITNAPVEMWLSGLEQIDLTMDDDDTRTTSNNSAAMYSFFLMPEDAS